LKITAGPLDENKQLSTKDNLALPTQANEASKKLFRAEAVEHATFRSYGTVILTRPIHHTILVATFTTLILLLIGFFVFFETTRKASIQGMLVPASGVIRVFPNQVGVIKEIRIKEGQFVKSGDVLFVLTGERGNADSRSTEAMISALLVQRRDSFQAELGHAKTQAVHRRTVLLRRAEDLKVDIKRLDGQALMQKQRIALSEKTVSRFAELKTTNYISAAQLQEREAELIDQQQRLVEIERNRSSMLREFASAMADAQDISVQALRDENALRRNASVLEQDLTENEARREIPILAHQNGTVTAIAASIGQTVGNAVSLASILPEGNQLEAEMYVPSRAVGFMKPGITAMLRFQAFPYQKFGQHPAHIREIAITSVRPEELPISAGGIPGIAQSEPVYRIRLKLNHQTVQAYGVPMPLRSGMLVDASVMLEKRRLYEWVFEPLLSISGRM